MIWLDTLAAIAHRWKIVVDIRLEERAPSEPERPLFDVLAPALPKPRGDDWLTSDLRLDLLEAKIVEAERRLDGP